MTWECERPPLRCLDKVLGGCGKSYYSAVDEKSGYAIYGCVYCNTKFSYITELPPGFMPYCSTECGGCGRIQNGVVVKLKAREGSITKADLDRDILTRIPPEPDPANYIKYCDGRAQFDAAALAEATKKHIIIKTCLDNREMFVYKGGIFVPGGENIIRQMARELAGSELTSHQANEVLFHVETTTFVNRASLEAPLNLIHLNNGILDINTGTFMPHSPDIPALTKIPIDYDENATCPAIEKFLSEILDQDDILTIQEIIGYLLIREYCYHKAFMFIGSGSNGKTTFLNLLAVYVGNDNATNVSLQALVNDRFAPGRLYGKLLNFFADLSNEALNQTGWFKALTGNDWLEGERKFKDSFRFKNHAKLIFSCNTMPRANDDTDAFHRRWVYMTFSRTFPDDDPKTDKNILDKLTIPSELSGLLNWGLLGLKRLTEKNGNFTTSKSVLENRARNELMSDPLSAFLHSAWKADPEGTVIKTDLYEYYSIFCEIYGLPKVSPETVGRRMPGILPYLKSTKIGPTGARKTAWQGLRHLTVTESQDENDGSVKDGKVLLYFNRIYEKVSIRERKNLDNPDTQTCLDDQGGTLINSTGGMEPD